MKLATRKFFHNMMAMVVSVCMVLTLTPSAAWAAQLSEDGNSLVTSDTASTSVKAEVYDPESDFTFITPGTNYEDASSFIKDFSKRPQTERTPLYAQISESGLFDTSYVTWSMWEVELKDGSNPDAPEYEHVGNATTLQKNTYKKSEISSLLSDSMNSSTSAERVPTFHYPNDNGDGVEVAPDALKIDENKMYEFSVVVSPSEDPTVSAAKRATTVMTFLKKYKTQFIQDEDDDSISIRGSIYQQTTPPFGATVIESSSVPSSNAAFAAIRDKAAKTTPVAETIESVTELTLVNNVAGGDDLYTGTLEMTLPLPDAIIEKGWEEGHALNIYRVGDDGSVTVDTKGELAYLTDAEGNEVLVGGKPVPVALFYLSGTRNVLGKFAVGIPDDRTYKVTTSSTYGGMITPASEPGEIIEIPYTGATTFSTYAATPGYAFDGFEVKVGSRDITSQIRDADLGYNCITIDPANYPLITEDSTVSITAYYVPRTLGGNNNTISVGASLDCENNADGYYKISSILTDELSEEVDRYSSFSGAQMDLAAGIFLEFFPNSGSMVKSVFIDEGDGEREVVVQGSTLLISASDYDIDIRVVYDKGEMPSAGPDKTIDISVTKRPNGNKPATLLDDDGKEVDTLTVSVGAGGHVMINAYPVKDEYILKQVLVYSPAGSTSPTNVINYVKPAENDGEDNPTDIINLFNIVDDIEIELKYEMTPGKIENDYSESEGGYWGWILPDRAKEQALSDQGFSTYSLRAMSASSYAASENLWQSSFNLLENESARLIIYPEDGYELSNVYVNGDSVMRLLTDYTATSGYYAMTVYRGEVGSGTDVGLYGSEQDQVYYTNGSLSMTKVVFSPAVIAVPEYVTISTSVTDFGGGSITPSFRIVSGSENVEGAGNARVEFFPDAGYKVSKIWIGGRTVNISRDDRVKDNGLAVELTNVTTDTSVQVEFTTGEQEGGDKERVTVNATAGAGGSITPAGSFQVYKGTKQSFTLVPSTGYRISTVSINGEETGMWGSDDNQYFTSRNTFTIDADENTDIQATFVKEGTNPASNFNVSATKEGSGTISPAGSMSVGAGSDVTFTVIPEDDWYVREIRVIYAGPENSTTGTNMISLYNDSTYTFTLKDVRDDTTVKAVFAQCVDGKIPGTGEPDDPSTWKDKPSTPGDDDIITFDTGSTVVKPASTPGAIVSPSLDELTVVKEPGTNHGNANQPFTVTVLDGYDLTDPGIVVKDGDTDITNLVDITEVGDGVYTFVVPKDHVTPDLKIEVNAEPQATSSKNAESFDVSLSVIGDGYITPGMQSSATTSAVVKVEKGKGQTFNFIPDDGWKLFTVYLNGKPTTVTGNTLTISNVQQATTIEAAFSKLVDGEEAPEIATPVNVTVTKAGGDSNCTVSPMAASEAPLKVLSGNNLTINVAPSAGYSAKVTVSVPTQNITNKDVPVIGNTAEITNITAATNVVVTFEREAETNYCSLTVTSEGGGTTSPSGTTLVASGTTQIISFAPDAGQKVKSVKVKSGTGAEREQVSSVSSNLTLNLGTVSQTTQVKVVFCGADELGPSDPGSKLPAGDEVDFYNVTTSVENGGGVVSPGTAKVASGASITMTALPNNGYKLDKVAIGTRTLTFDKNTFTVSNVTSDTQVTVTFVKKNAVDLDDYYTVFVSSSDGGTVSPTGAITVAAGGSQTLTILPEPDYKVSAIHVKGQSDVKDFTGTAYTLFNITDNMWVSVEFKKLESGEKGTSTLTHEVTASSTVNGRISPEGVTKVANGKSASFTFVPNDGCKLSYVSIDGTDIDGSYIVNNQYIFSDVKENHTIHAVFIKDDGASYYTISVGRAENGTISPTGSVIAKEGDSKEFSVTPFYGYRISGITINGNPIKSGTFGNPTIGTTTTSDGVRFSYASKVLTIMNVSADAVIGATFEKDPTYYPDDGTKAPTYVPIAGTVKTDGSGAGGSTSIGAGGYIEQPGSDATSAEKNPQITIVPNPGSMVDKVVVTYGDGSKTVIDDKGTYEYNGDGVLLDSSGNPTSDSSGNPVKYPSVGPDGTDVPTKAMPNAKKIYEQGYVEIDGEKAADTGGVSVDVSFRKFEDGEEATVTSPTYYEINASYSGGGRLYPDGRVKVASGQNMIFQILPASGYELSALTVSGDSNAMDNVTSSRKYIFTNVTENKSINASFGFINDDLVKRYTVKATSNVAGAVSPGEVVVPEGADADVYFLPPEGQKVAHITVTNADGVVLDQDDFELPMYTVESVSSDTTVSVTYAAAGDNDVVWNFETIGVWADVPSGNGSVSPDSSASNQIIVPLNSPQTFYFKPDSGYVVDFVMFNDVATTLQNNPSSFEVTPSKGAENVLHVYFRPASAQDKQYTTITPTITLDDKGNSHASIAPTSVNVEVGSSVDFYITPDSGYTIDKVYVDGREVTARPALPEGETPVAGRIYDMYVITVDDIQADTKIEVTTTVATSMPVQVAKHTLTVTGTNVMYSPMGSVELPVGGKQLVVINPLTGYYLDYVMAYELDDDGNVVGEPSDITGSVVDDRFTVEMGTRDMRVEIKYLEVGASEAERQPAYITLGTTKHEDGRNVNATISMQRNGEGLLNPLTVGADRKLLDSDGNPIEFVRGSSYTFYVVGESIDEGKNLILSEASYNGQKQNVPNLSGMVANVKVNASGVLDLVFRDLKDGESPTVMKTFNVKFEIGGGIGSIGNVAGTDENGFISVVLGNSTGAVPIIPGTEGDEYWMISSVYEFGMDKDGNAVGSGTEIDARKYKDETYDCKPAADTLVRVTFEKCAFVDVNWDESLGFVAPNPATEYLKLPADEAGEPFQFIVAPYEGCYVDSFNVTPDGGDTVYLKEQLQQTSSVVNYFTDAERGYSVKDSAYSGGVVEPVYDENGNVVQTDSQVQAQSQSSSGYSTMSTELSTLSVKAIDYNGSIPSNGTVFQNAYGVHTDLDPTLTHVNVGLYTPQSRNERYTITPEVLAWDDGKTHGTISPNVPVTVTSSDEAIFNFSPENSNYVVREILIDGTPVSNAYGRGSYTVKDVTHDTKIQVKFGPRTSEESSRLLRVASSLAQTGDLTGPVVGFFLLLAGVGLFITAVSYIRRRRRMGARR